jgi:hypothetical protein
MENTCAMSKDGPSFNPTPDDMLGRHQADVARAIPEWFDALAKDPSCFPVLEEKIHQLFKRGADLLSMSLINTIHPLESFDIAAEELRSGYAVPLSRGRPRSIAICLLGGLVIWFRSIYCEPKKGVYGKGDKDKVPGIWIGLAQFGLSNGCTPALEAYIARQVAGTHSFEFAVSELNRQGIQMSTKAVRRISYAVGEELLSVRTRDLKAWRAGTLKCGDQLKGAKVSVQVDGGRIKIRSALKDLLFKGLNIRKDAIDSEGLAATKQNALLEEDGGRAKAKQKPKRTFESDWREPKLVTIFTTDKNGKQVRQSQAWIEGTLEGPDALAEIVAMYLYKLGAAHAESITFVSDGAVWIWDRIDNIVAQAKIPKAVRIYKILDCCHAIGKMHHGLKHFGLPVRMEKGLYRMHRKQIRDGDWNSVVRSLQKRLDRKKRLPDKVRQEIQADINYLRTHGSQGHMDYPMFSLMGLPLGSGAIESSIRRVINLRLKSNAVFWRAENAEPMLQLRCHYISKQLDERLKAKRKSFLENGRRDWRWEPQKMSVKSEDTLSTSA